MSGSLCKTLLRISLHGWNVFFRCFVHFWWEINGKTLAEQFGNLFIVMLQKEKSFESQEELAIVIH